MQQPLRARLISTWAAWLACPPVALWRPGTTVRADERREPGEAVQLWPVTPEHVLVEAMPPLVEPIRALLARRPVGHRLSADDLLLGLSRQMVAVDRLRVLAMDPAAITAVSQPGGGRQGGRAFRRGGKGANTAAAANTAAGANTAVAAVAAPEGMTLRRLGPQDREALEAMLRRCYRQERLDADVGLDGDHLAAVGVLEGPRLLTVASAASWRGFADLGVITDPAGRGRGAARAAVLAVVAELARTASAPRPVVLYRYVVDNAGSHTLAGRLPLQYVGEGETVRLTDAQ